MKKIILCLAVTSLLACPVFAGEAHKHAGSKEAASVTALQGEVLDMNCYMEHAGAGAKHAKCAKSCAVGGAALGLLKADGSAVLLLENHDKSKGFAKVRELAAEQVKLTGKLVSRGGMQAFIVDGVEKAGK